jgi:osmotically inducible lipoprotein OsmB
MKKCFALILVVFLFAGACAGGTGLGPTANTTLTGGLVGAGGGALIGAAAGSPGTGAAIGAGAGVLGGFLFDQYRRNQGLGPYGQ